MSGKERTRDINQQPDGLPDTGQDIALRHVGVLYHPSKPDSHELADEITGELRGFGIKTWTGLTGDDEASRQHIADFDLLLVLGGDGSTLRAARLAAGYDTLLLGINMGRIGFLSEMTPANWRQRLPDLLAGRFRIEKRMMLQAESWRGETLLGRHLTLNDVVVSRGSLARVVHLRTHIDGHYLTNYVADGLIVATPTGSTAYALAVGGPILPPELNNFLLIPIAAHMSLNRAIVLSQNSKVSMRVATDHQVMLTVDGQFEFELQDGDRVDVHRSQHISHFVRLGDSSDFYRTLLARLEPKPQDEAD